MASRILYFLVSIPNHITPNCFKFSVVLYSSVITSGNFGQIFRLHFLTSVRCCHHIVAPIIHTVILTIIFCLPQNLVGPLPFTSTNYTLFQCRCCVHWRNTCYVWMRILASSWNGNEIIICMWIITKVTCYELAHLKDYTQTSVNKLSSERTWSVNNVRCHKKIEDT